MVVSSILTPVICDVKCYRIRTCILQSSKASAADAQWSKQILKQTPDTDKTDPEQTEQATPPSYFAHMSHLSIQVNSTSGAAEQCTS